MFNKILIVCIGNICRSPMVEAIFKHRLASTHPAVSVSSAGISAMVGKPADSHVQEILITEGIDCSMHRARQLTSAMLLETDLVLVMEEEQRKEITCTFPSVYGKVHLLGKWGGFEVPDPYKKPREFFDGTFHLVKQGIDQWQTRLWK